MPKKKSSKTSAAEKAQEGRVGVLVPDKYFKYFLSLSLRNVRCFGDHMQTLDLSDGDGQPAQWTILLGNNGTGKTTVLQALLRFSATPYLAAARPGSIRVEFERAETRLDRTEASAAPDLYAAIASGPPLDAARGRYTMHRIALPAYGEPFTASVDPDSGATAVLVPEVAIITEGLECYAYGAGRRMGPAGLSNKAIDHPTASLFSDQATLRNAEEWLLQADYAASKTKKPQYRERLNQVKDVLVNILPEVSKVRLTQPKKTRPTTTVQFETPYGWVPLHSIGYGYQTMIAWMVDFASRMVERYPDSPDPLAEPAVVLVDEIDLHLHPKWQREVMSYLTERFPNTQFIATAHNPLIVQAAPSVNANIAVLRREGDHVVIDNDVEAIEGWRIDQILTSDLYDLPTARPAEFDRAIKRRTELLSKARLSKADRKELAELEKRLDQLPVGENVSEARKIVALARDTVEMLKKHQGKGE